MFIWWLGWFPGFLSPDSLDQLGQVESGNYTNGHPAFHTITLWFITRFWDNAGAITLVQIALLALLLGVVARRLIDLGVPVWLAVGAGWVIGLLPAVATTTLTIWKDVAFTLAFVWVFSELLLLVRDGSEYWSSRWNPIRLGVGLSLVWLYRHNGLLTALVVLAILAWVYRAHLNRVAIAALTLLAIVLVVQGPVFWIFSVGGGKPAVAEVLLPVVASSFVHEPGNFDNSEVALLASIAPVEVWQTRYDCDLADPLLFDPAMNIEVIRQDPSPFLRLGIRTVFRDLDTTLGMLWCRASYLVVPPQPSDAHLFRPPFRVPANDLGLARSPVWTAAYENTVDIFVNAESRGWIWLAWRPALVIWLMVATYVALAARRTWVMLIPGSLLGIHLLNVAATSINQEFRLAFPLYVAGILSLPLLWFVRFPLQLTRADLESSGRPFNDDDVASVRLGERQAQRVE